MKSRQRQIAEDMAGALTAESCQGCDQCVELIEQALLLERRLAMESLSKYLCHIGLCQFTFEGRREECTCGLFEALRSAAEREVENV